MNGLLILICGDDDYLVDSAARERVNQLVPEAERTLGVEIIEARCDNGDEVRRTVDDCLGSVQTPGFFGANKVTWLRNANFLTGAGRVSESQTAKTAVEQLTSWIKKGACAGQNLVITTGKVLRTSIFFKACQKQGEVIDFGGSFKGWELEKQASERLDGLLKKAGLSMDQSAHREFLNRVGYDTRLLVQEIEKLRVYLGAPGPVTVNDVRAVTSIGREAEAWDLLDAFGERKPQLVLEALQRMDGQKGIGIMLATMLDRRVRELIVLREAIERKLLSLSGVWASDLPADVLALLSILPVNQKTMKPWILKKRMPQVQAYTLQELRIARFRILALREKLVSSSLPEQYLLETTLLRIMGAKSGKRGGQQVTGAR